MRALTVMEGMVLNLLALASGFLLIYWILKRRLEARFKPEAFLEEIRGEINRTIAELNRTAERNVALIEDRIQRLMELLAAADKKIGLLQREEEKHSLSRQVYRQLAQARSEMAAAAPKAEEKPEAREEILRLHRAGFPSALISKRIGAPLGEVELIIALGGKDERTVDRG